MCKITQWRLKCNFENTSDRDKLQFFFAVFELSVTHLCFSYTVCSISWNKSWEWGTGPKLRTRDLVPKAKVFSSLPLPPPPSPRTLGGGTSVRGWHQWRAAVSRGRVAQFMAA